jgi:DNA-binding PadR family transcriptional regulator
MISKKERFGGELVELSKQHVDENAKVPTIYAILKRLTDTGFLKEKSKLQEIGVTRGKPRTYYEITPGGKAYLESMQRQINSSLIPCNLEKLTIEEE